MIIRMDLDAPRSTRRRPAPGRRPGYRPVLEGLEARLVLSTINWNGAGDGTSFGSKLNWVGGVVPGSTDNAVINVASGVTIRLPTAGATVNSLAQSGGTLVASSGTLATTTGLSLDNGVFDDLGGSITGPASLDSSTLEDNAAAGPAAIAVGGSCNLDGTIPAGQTIRVEGGLDYNANFTLDLGSTNLGTLLLQPLSSSFNSSNLIADSGSTFVNSGLVQVNASNRSGSLTGSFDNQGTVTVSGGATLYVGSAGLGFTQDAGGVINSPSDNLLCDAGTLLVKGGTINGTVEADGCAVQVAATLTTPATIDAAGSYTTLVSNDAPSATIRVEGGLDYNADLTLDQGAANLGTLLLWPLASSFNSSNLVVASGSTFVNSGLVQVNASNRSGSLTGNFDNQGTVTVPGGTTLDVGVTGLGFTQDVGGVINSPSDNLLCDAGTLLVKGGTINGTVEADGCAVQVAATLTTPATIDAAGSYTTLVSNDAPSATIRVEGGLDYNAILTLDQGANNLGTLLLLPLASSFNSSNLVVASGSTFTNAGLVQVNSSNRTGSLTGNFDNQGTLGIAGTTLTLLGSGTSLLNLPRGVINASGTLDDSATSFVNGGTLSVATGSAATLKIIGAYTQTATGALNVELGGTTAGTLFDQLAVTGATTLAGSVDVSLINGFLPVNTNSFKVMTFASASGMFTTFRGTNLFNGLILQPSQTSTAFTLNAAPAPRADLGVTVSAQPAGVTLGGSIVYSVTVTNNGPNDAQGVVLADQMPAGVAPDSIAITSGSYTTSGDLLTATIPSITVGGSVLLTITETPSTTGTYTDAASATATISYDPDTSNNAASASAAVVPPQADLVVGVSAPSPQVILGGTVTYLVTLTNNGPDDAQGVALSDFFPIGSTVDSATASRGIPAILTDRATLDLDTLADGASVTLTIVVTPASTGPATDTASVTDASPIDPNPSNNSGSATSTVVPPASADLSTTIVGPSTPLTTTGKLTYTVTIANLGPNTANGSTLTETFALPPGASLASEAASQGTLVVSARR